jgi:hypothetical protein
MEASHIQNNFPGHKGFSLWCPFNLLFQVIQFVVMYGSNGQSVRIITKWCSLVVSATAGCSRRCQGSNTDLRTGYSDCCYVFHILSLKILVLYLKLNKVHFIFIFFPIFVYSFSHYLMLCYASYWNPH